MRLAVTVRRLATLVTTQARRVAAFLTGRVSDDTAAGLLERRQPDEQAPVESSTVLATTADDPMRPIHERIPEAGPIGAIEG